MKNVKRSIRVCLAVALAVVAGGSLGVGTQGTTPPILLVVNSASGNPFGPYLAEILKAEGLNSYAVADLATVTPAQLNSAGVVVLAETALSDAEALTFSNYVAAGGALIAMRPDAKLAPALGVTPAGSSTTQGYIGINTLSILGEGFTSTTLPFHGTAQHYTLDPGATTVAALYSTSTTSTGFAAVAKKGKAVTWAYDLARSVAYARQGNPANAGVDVDGVPPLRTTDVFYQHIDLDRVGIPHADVQMRLFGRVINDLLSDAVPLPRLWYFPNAKRTMLVITSDSHANPLSYFTTFVSSVEARGARASIYINGGSDPSPSLVATWRANGHEVGMHPRAYQSGISLNQAFADNYSYFVNNGYGLPGPTERIHQFEWQGWTTAASTAANYGIKLDTSFYTWGPGVTYPNGTQAHGYINGSGLPMPFVDQAGAILPVYQLVTPLIDEQLVIGEYSEHLTPTQALAVSRQLIDASQAGDYSAIMTQFHIDYFQFGEVRPWAEGTMDYANSLGVPMWTAERMLNYTSARGATTMTGVTWSAAAKQLSFNVTVPAGSEAQSVALPYAFQGFGLTSLTLDGSAATTTQATITGRDTRFLNVGPGSHTVVATFNTPVPPPEHPPVAANDSASVTDGQTVTIPVLNNDTDIDGDALTVTNVGPSGGNVVINANQTLSYTPNAGTCGIDTFTYTISDGRGGTASATVTVNVTCVNGLVTHTTTTDFGACAVPTNTFVSAISGGEVRLAGTQSDDYAQPVLNSARWVAGNWAGGAYTPTISGGVMSIAAASGAFVRSAASMSVTTLETSARFTGARWEHVGWSSLNFDPAYLIFSTYNTTTNLYARSNSGAGEQLTDLGAIPAGFHTYRIDRQSVSPSSNIVRYYIDGVLRAQHTVGALASMYVYQSHNGGTAPTLDIDSISAYPAYTSSGTFQSCTMTIGSPQSAWTTATWDAVVPTGTTLQLRTRTSADGTSWSAWSAPLTTSGQSITSPSGAYLQYLIEATSTDANQSPVVNSVSMHFADGSIPQPHAPVAVNDTASTSEGGSVSVAVLANDSDIDGDPLTVISTTQGANGSVVINPNQTVTYTSNPLTCGPDSFTYTISDGNGGTATATVSVGVVCLSGQVTHTTAADFGACALPTNTFVTDVSGGEVQLAGAFSEDYSQAALNPARWVSGTWAGGAYQPTATGGILSISNAAGAYVRSVGTMPVTTLEASARIGSAPWQHLGWGSLDFAGTYAMFSTYNSSTNLYARTEGGGGEQRTDLGAIPAGFHTYRIGRQTASPGNDLVSYYIDGVLRAQHTVPALPALYVYQSHNGGTSVTLDIDYIRVYPAFVGSGTFQSCTVDGGTGSFSWTTANWAATVPTNTTLQLRTRTSPDGAAWSAWSAPVVASGNSITSPSGRYLQYLLELTSTDANATPVVDSVTIRFLAGTADTTPPVLSGIGASNVSQTGAVISWTTNETSTSQVEYGPTVAYGSSTAIDPALVTSHSQALTGLVSNTQYNFRVKSRDGPGNEAVSSNFLFTTSAPTISINDVSVTEGNTGTANAVFTLSLSSPSGLPVGISYATAAGTATAPSDFATLSGSLTIPAGSTTGTFSVAVNSDALNEADETFLVNLSAPTNATILDGQGVGTIVNDDPLPSISIADVSVTEGNTGTLNAVFTVSLSAASGRAVGVSYATADGTATAPADYTAQTGTLSIPAGSTSATITVVVTNDLVNEANETFLVNLTAPTNATILDAQGVGTIVNNDAVPSISIGDVSVNEGNTGTSNAAFTVSLSAVSGQTVSVNYATAAGTATAGTDYVTQSGTLSFPAGTTNVTLNVAVVGDLNFEPNETFVVNLTAPTNATILDTQGQGTIVNDDPVPSMSVNDVSVTEGNTGTTTATFTVSLSAASTQAISVNYATAAGTATAATDYVTRTGSLSFPAGTTAVTLAVTVNGDTTFEPNETFFLNLSAPANATLSDAQGLGTIVNDDAVPAISIGDVSITEGNSGSANAAFAVTLSNASSQAISVAYATANGTATSGTDYTAVSGTLNIAAGATSGTITVPVLGETAPEPDETFTVNLTAPVNATIADASATGTILDNDATITVTVPNTNVNWAIGSQQTITWTNNLGTTAQMLLELSRNGGSTWEVIAPAVQNSSATGGSYTWTVTGAATTAARVRATWTANTRFSDISNANFTIAAPTLTVTSPNGGGGGNTWLVGTTRTITWTNNLGTLENVRIELSLNGGTSYSIVLFASTPSDGTESIVVQPAWITPTARVRITWLDGSASDTSNSNFAIQ